MSQTDPDGHDVNICDNNNNCHQVSNEDYQKAQQANNGSPNVPTLDQVGSNGNGSGQFNASNITDSSGNTVGTATYVSNGNLDYYANANGYQTLVTASKGVTQVTLAAAAIYSIPMAAMVGADVAAGTAAMRSQVIMRLGHGLNLASKLNIGHSAVIVGESALKNAIATAIASGAVQQIGSRFEGVVSVAGTLVKFTGGYNGAQMIVTNVMRADHLQ